LANSSYEWIATPTTSPNWKKRKKKKKKKVYLHLEDNENEKVHVREEHQLSLVQA
jgi:hypothetical protein